MDNLFYTYAYLRKDGTPYYIGKGTGNRCFRTWGRASMRPSKDRILILKKNLTEEEAFKHEVYLIAILGRKDLGTGILRNRTNGGDGCSGMTHSEETRAKISAAHTGKKSGPISEERRAKISAAIKGKKHSAETRAKISAAAKGRPNLCKGKPRSEETRAKISATMKGRTLSEETRAKMSEAARKRKVR